MQSPANATLLELLSGESIDPEVARQLFEDLQTGNATLEDVAAALSEPAAGSPASAEQQPAPVAAQQRNRGLSVQTAHQEARKRLAASEAGHHAGRRHPAAPGWRDDGGSACEGSPWSIDVPPPPKAPPRRGGALMHEAATEFDSPVLPREDEEELARAASVTKFLCVAVKEVARLFCSFGRELLDWATSARLQYVQQHGMVDVVLKSLRELNNWDLPGLLRRVWPECEKVAMEVEQILNEAQVGVECFRLHAASKKNDEVFLISADEYEKCHLALQRQNVEVCTVTDELFKKTLRKLQEERVAWVEEKRVLCLQRNALLRDLEASKDATLRGKWVDLVGLEQAVDSGLGGGHTIGGLFECYSHAVGGWVLGRLESVRSDGCRILSGDLCAPPESLRPAIGASAKLLHVGSQRLAEGRSCGCYVSARHPMRDACYWLRSCDEAWPARLHVAGPSTGVSYAGTYDLTPETARLGFPAWRQRNGDAWLFSGIGDHWFVGCLPSGKGMQAAPDFQALSGFISTTGPHGGELPHKMEPDSWCVFDGIQWANDARVAVVELPVQQALLLKERQARAPAVLVIELAEATHPCIGEYILAESVGANGFPLWRKRGSDHVIYSSPLGQWIVGQSEEGELAYRRETGHLASLGTHGGRMPQAMPKDRWMLLEGDHWRVNKWISISSHAPKRWTTVFKEGEGDLGFALSLAAEGKAPERVFVEAVDRDSLAATHGIVQGDELVTVNGQDVTEVSSEGMISALGRRPLHLCVVKERVLRKSEKIPDTLYVEAPWTSAGLSGNYALVPGVSPNGFPLWKQAAGDHYLFSGLTGRWFIGDLSERDINFEADTGLVASLHLHAGRMPDEIPRGSFMRLDGEDWKMDQSISIMSDACGGFKTVGVPPAPVKVSSVVAGTYAAQHAAPGDELLKVKGLFAAAMAPEALTKALAEERPLPLTFWRGDKPRQFEVLVEEDVAALGCRLLGMPPEPVHLAGLEVGSWPTKNGLAQGDTLVKVNGEKVATMSFDALVEGLLQRPLRLLVLRGGGRLATEASKSAQLVRKQGGAFF
eukprot:TRINITY_DN31603_c0_g1_i1.p1 TRINITY_DN31603_c0_g1~~TRINITY_DN31603_c0_g1_i1.p1  ORF type:complete len:1055 (+),score=232.77 TRINITY_DN31603_c0_g1_i1:155-3319(+)